MDQLNIMRPGSEGLLLEFIMPQIVYEGGEQIFKKVLH